jgi:catechol 2,3-dioxygenase-like lactoylglutathione lyase family enzyme
VTVTLNHTVVTALDNRAAARFFATVMGLECLPPAGEHDHFVPVRVNDSLTVDFLTVAEPAGHHLAFDVDPETFDRILARLRELGVPYGNDPRTPANGRVDHPLCARGLFFADDARNLYEVMSPA